MSNLQRLADDLTMTFTRNKSGAYDIWFNFAGVTKHASISLMALSEKSGAIIGEAIKQWVEVQVEKHCAALIEAEERQQEIDDNSQFGVGG